MPENIETFEFHDMDQYIDFSAQFMDALSIQLQPGRLHILNQVFQLDGITIAHYASNQRMLQTLAIPPQQLMFVLTAPIVNDCKWCGVDVPGDSLAILHPHQEHQALVPEGWNSIEFLIDDTTLIKHELLSEVMWQQTRQPQQAIFSRQASRIKSLRQKVLHYFQTPELFSSVLGDQNAQALLKNLILDELRAIMLAAELLHKKHHQPIFPSRRYQTFSRALAFIEDNYQLPLSIPKICAQIGTSPRTLQLTFQELTGHSPYNYILSRKLHAIQQELVKLNCAAHPIFQIAEKYGLQHAERFGQQYKQMFAESPSATVKRRC